MLNYIAGLPDHVASMRGRSLSIEAATKHFNPYLIQSSKKACILTDSKPCVQAYEKLCRGEVSASPRVSTFLSVVSRYQASVRHVSGACILQSDFESRNAAPCDNETCQVCAFITRTRDSVVRAVSVHDVLQGNVRLPFTSRPAWLAVQSECQDQRRTNALTSRTSNVIYELHLLQMMASLFCNVIILCHRPESALSSHVRLWMAF